MLRLLVLLSAALFAASCATTGSGATPTPSAEGSGSVLTPAAATGATPATREGAPLHYFGPVADPGPDSALRPKKLLKWDQRDARSRRRLALEREGQSERQRRLEEHLADPELLTWTPGDGEELSRRIALLDGLNPGQSVKVCSQLRSTWHLALSKNCRNEVSAITISRAAVVTFDSFEQACYADVYLLQELARRLSEEVHTPVAPDIDDAPAGELYIELMACEVNFAANRNLSTARLHVVRNLQGDIVTEANPSGQTVPQLAWGVFGGFDVDANVVFTVRRK